VIGPGDTGPCPLCGKDMGEEEYSQRLLNGTIVMCSGRYWHMRHEHGILEDYHPPPLLTGNERVVRSPQPYVSPDEVP
jgi:hypothetical protein